jgi:hypothetical protein
MSGLNRQLVDRVLGYDDDYRSTEATRNFNFGLWYTRARPEYVLQLSTPKIIMRPAGNDAEYVVQKIVEHTLNRMKQDR